VTRAPHPPDGAPPSGLLGALTRAGRYLLGLPAPVVALLGAAWMVLIWSLSGSKLPTPKEKSTLWQIVLNLGHAPMFGTLGLLVSALVLRGSEPGRWRVGRWQAAVVLGWVAAYAIVDEWHQAHTPGRHPSGFDVATDVIGAACVLWIVAYLGTARASERGLRLRLAGGVGLCLAAALAAWAA